MASLTYLAVYDATPPAPAAVSVVRWRSGCIGLNWPISAQSLGRYCRYDTLLPPRLSELW